MRLGMKHVLVSFSLALVAVFTPNMLYRVDDVAMRRAITSTLNYMPSTETNHQREVHAVVVDMPNGHRWSTLLLTPGALYRRSIHRMRNLQQNRYCR